MARKSTVWSLTLPNEGIEILPYNSKRISASIYGDGWTSNAYARFGSSKQQAIAATTLYLYYYPFIWPGINALWGANNVNNPNLSNILIVELVEE